MRRYHRSDGREPGGHAKLPYGQGLLERSECQLSVTNICPISADSKGLYTPQSELTFGQNAAKFLRKCPIARINWCHVPGVSFNQNFSVRRFPRGNMPRDSTVVNFWSLLSPRFSPEIVAQPNWVRQLWLRRISPIFRPEPLFCQQFSESFAYTYVQRQVLRPKLVKIGGKSSREQSVLWLWLDSSVFGDFAYYKLTITNHHYYEPSFWYGMQTFHEVKFLWVISDELKAPVFRQCRQIAPISPIISAFWIRIVCKLVLAMNNNWTIVK